MQVIAITIKNKNQRAYFSLKDESNISLRKKSTTLLPNSERYGACDYSPLFSMWVIFFLPRFHYLESQNSLKAIYYL